MCVYTVHLLKLAYRLVEHLCYTDRSEGHQLEGSAKQDIDEVWGNLKLTQSKWFEAAH